MTPFTTFPLAAGARIISLGGYQPANVVTNDDLADPLVAGIDAALRQIVVGHDVFRQIHATTYDTGADH